MEPEPHVGRGHAGLTSVEHRPPGDPVTGWRYWQVRASSGRLRSITHRRIEWRPGEVVRALCLLSAGHTAPAEGCACGVHAAPSLEALLADSLCMVPTEPLVMGSADLWGAVVTDDHGLRAEYARPSRLSVVTPDPHDPATLVALRQLEAYGVPLATVAPEDALGDIAATILRHQSISR